MEANERVERELGVPIPGRILEPGLWTKTALKKLPPPGPLDWHAIYGRKAPIIVDLGCGNGRFLLGSALARPDCDHLGIDILPVVIRYATRRGNQRGLANLRFAVIDAERFLEHYAAPSAIREMHLYHPQPYYDPNKIHKRLITPTFMTRVHRALESGGKFYLQTDHPGYWNYVRNIVPLFFDFEERATPWPDAPKGRTRREIMATKQGLSVFRGVGTRRDLLAVEEADRIASALPLPRFDADRRLIQLDQQESRAE